MTRRRHSKKDKSQSKAIVQQQLDSYPYDATHRAFASGNAAAVIAAASGDLANALLAATPGGVEAQEKAGQAVLTAHFTTLPIDGMERYRGILESWGFRIGDAADDIFVTVTPPQGWRLKPTDHSMWSELVDAAGGVRGGVFYKAAFYDRSSHFSLNPRYRIAAEYGDTGVWWHVADRKTGDVIFDLHVVPVADRKASDLAEAACREWLVAHFPLWQAIEAYWEVK